jgi:hypothetical protein
VISGWYKAGVSSGPSYLAAIGPRLGLPQVKQFGTQ